MQIDPELRSFATPRQIEYLDAIEKYGSQRKAAKALGVAKSAVDAAINRLRSDAARRGYSPQHDMTHPVPDGYKLRGTSTYYDKDGKFAGQWVKSTLDEEKQREFMRAAFDAMAEELPQVSARPAANSYLPALMAVYPIGDAHIGMRAWGEETQSGDWDMQIAERVQCGAMAELVDLAPPAEKAVVINLGDWFHSDNIEGVTPRSKNHLDVDGRYAKMVRVGMKVMRQCIESALDKHKTVRVINVIGNHDDTGAIWLSVALKHMYANEPRIEVDDSPAAFMYFEHGKVLVGCHHGHTCSAERLPGVMAADRPKAWGRTEYRYWYVGHIHHQSVKEYAGVTVESFGTLTAKDAYAAWGGYRAQQNMKCIVLHSEYGEVCRHTVSPKMLEAASPGERAMT